MLTAPGGGHASCPRECDFTLAVKRFIGAADGPRHRLFMRGQLGPHKGRRGFPRAWSRAAVEVGGKYWFRGPFLALPNTELERYVAKVRVASSSLVSRSTP
jgi:hypothetical protein